MSQAQGKKPKDTHATSHSEVASAAEEKTRTLNKLELAQVLEKAEGEWSNTQGEELTPRPLPVVEFGSLEASKRNSALFALDAEQTEPGGVPTLEREAIQAEGQNHKAPAKSPKAFLLIGMLIGVLMGGALFMLGRGLL